MTSEMCVISEFDDIDYLLNPCGELLRSPNGNAFKSEVKINNLNPRFFQLFSDQMFLVWSTVEYQTPSAACFAAYV